MKLHHKLIVAVFALIFDISPMAMAAVLIFQPSRLVLML